MAFKKDEIKICGREKILGLQGYLRSIESEVVTIWNDWDLDISLANVVAIEFLGSDLSCLLVLEQNRAEAILSPIGPDTKNGAFLDVPVVSEKVSDLLVPDLVR